LAAKWLLAKEGYDPLKTKLLAGEFKPGEKIKVTAKDDALVFQKK